MAGNDAVSNFWVPLAILREKNKAEGRRPIQGGKPTMRIADPR